MQELTLISHALCPYVQRAIIVLNEKGLSFTRKDIDLAKKPEWFLSISPLSKTPILLVDNEPIFESSVICEYLDETLKPRLHPEDPLQRAQHRSWMEFGSSILNAIASLYTAKDDTTLQLAVEVVRNKFRLLENVLGHGPFFSGETFCIIDAVFGPIFRYFDVFEEIDDFFIFNNLTKVQSYRTALSQRPSVRAAVSENYSEQLHSFLRAKSSALSQRMSDARANDYQGLSILSTQE